MLKSIDFYITKQKNLKEKILSIGTHILKSDLNHNIQKIEKMIEKRDLLISQFLKLQNKIEIFIKHSNISSQNKKERKIIDSWREDQSIWSNKVKELDRAIIQSLSLKKIEISYEISHLLKHKYKLKAYHLTS